MIEVLGQKFENNDVIYIKYKNDYRVGFIKDKDFVDKILNVVSLSSNSESKRGNFMIKLKNILEIRKIDVNVASEVKNG